MIPERDTTRWGLLAVAVLAVAAGCSGVSNPGTAATQTVTPAPVPEPRDGFAPGVTAGGMNTSAVISAHQQHLENRSYTLRTTLTVRNRSTEAVQWRERTVARVAISGSPFTYTRNYTEPRPFDGLVSSALYYDGTTTTRRSVYANESIGFDRFDRRTNVDLTGAAILRRSLYQLDGVVVRQGTGRNTIVSGTVRYPRALPTPPSVQATSTATVSASITPSGLVEQFVMGYDVRSNDGPARVRFSMRMTDRDSTTVSTPEWHRST